MAKTDKVLPGEPVELRCCGNSIMRVMGKAQGVGKDVSVKMTAFECPRCGLHYKWVAKDLRWVTF